MEIAIFIVGLVGGFAWGRYALNPRRTMRRITNGGYLFRPILRGILLGAILVFIYTLITQ